MIRKKPITVGIVVPGRIWRQPGTDKEKLKQQIDLAWDYLDSIGIEAGLSPKVVYSNDSRLGGKVHLMPLNKKDQPMFSHWDKGGNWESGLFVAGGAALGGAAAYVGSIVGNKMVNHDVFGMAREFQLPHALNIGYQELLKDEPSIKFTPKGDSYDMLNDTIRVIQNRGAIAKYYNENVLPGRSIGFETSALGYGSKPILSEGTRDTVFDLMEYSNELYRKLGGTDPLTIAKQVEKEKIVEQQKNKEAEITKIKPKQPNNKQQDQSKPKSERRQLVDELLSSGDY